MSYYFFFSSRRRHTRCSRDWSSDVCSSERLRQDDGASWRERLSAAGVPAAPVADVADVAESPQTEALGMLQELPHPSIPDLRLPALPLSLDEERALHPSPPPLVGQHTA